MAFLEFTFRNNIGSFPVIHEVFEIFRVKDNNFVRFPNYRVLQLSSIDDDLESIKVSPFFSILFGSGKTFISKGIKFDVKEVSFYNMSRNLFSLRDILENIDLCTFYYRDLSMNLKDFLSKLDSDFFIEKHIDVRCLYLFDLSESLFSPLQKEEIIFENKLGNFRFECKFNNLFR
ncbi:hypothetical protein Thena_1120 [Thermodesulfobium narugense DSM 14796]|uniref:Uncharacterized protein n=1 Tax=Thermodesulfobium narugense DSM 14796 TaxID=747365 RepID=M1E6D2_9BACT|nr:hypothetical protein [Thermodesulfobium narugense]AEE14741.1 hypothetical protein Thena_1120 [Thermodesulfobium narugense DSM 14796]